MTAEDVRVYVFIGIVMGFALVALLVYGTTPQCPECGENLIRVSRYVGKKKVVSWVCRYGHGRKR